jgi:hypothetical protein
MRETGRLRIGAGRGIDCSAVAATNALPAPRPIHPAGGFYFVRHGGSRDLARGEIFGVVILANANPAL